MGFLSSIKKSFSSTVAFFSDSWSELKKVRWPNRKELTSYTIVVLVTVTIVTVYFAILDFGITKLLRLFFD